MSDILIKNMKMPTSCITCPLCECRNECAYCEVGDKYLSWDWDERLRSSRNDHCPLTEVPPHGRLIDADALKEQWLNAEKTIGAEKVLNLPLECFISYGCVYDLDNAPTIIEAEGT